MLNQNVKLADNSVLNDYIAEFTKDVNLTISNLREKSLSVSSIRAKWLSYYFKEKENLERSKVLKQKILKQKTAGVKNQDSVLRLKSEDAISQNDERIVKLNTIMDSTKSNIDYIERCMNILNDFGFSVKNTIECLKLERA